MNNSPESSDRTFRRIWVFGGLFLFAGFGIVLLIDALYLRNCYRHRVEGPMVVLQGKILSEKKNRRGNLVWELEFERANGEHVYGRREVSSSLDEVGQVKAGPEDLPPPEGVVPKHAHDGQKVEIEDFPAAPQCWELHPSHEKRGLLLARDRFSLFLEVFFGLFFVVSGIGVAAWASGGSCWSWVVRKKSKD